MKKVIKQAKKGLAALLAVVMVLAVAPVPAAFAAGQTVVVPVVDGSSIGTFSITNVISQSDGMEKNDNFYLDDESNIRRRDKESVLYVDGVVQTIRVSGSTIITHKGSDAYYAMWIRCVDALDSNCIIEGNTRLTITAAGTYLLHVDAPNSPNYFLIIVEDDSTPPAPSGKTVNPTASTVYVNNSAKEFEAYTIDGSNYFKLRDLAIVLNGTGKQFEVGYDNATKAITLTSGKPYTIVGGEMAQGDGKPKTATPTASKIYLDGKELNLTVYNINGNNFFNLRDLMKAINVYVGYDNATKNITVDPSKSYVDESSGQNPNQSGNITISSDIPALQEGDPTVEELVSRMSAKGITCDELIDGRPAYILTDVEVNSIIKNVPGYDGRFDFMSTSGYMRNIGGRNVFLVYNVPQ